MVQAHQSIELRIVHIRGIFRSDESIGICWVAHHKHADIARGIVIDGLALLGEDGTIGFQQIRTLHTLAARARAYEEGSRGVFKGLL